MNQVVLTSLAYIASIIIAQYISVNYFLMLKLNYPMVVSAIIYILWYLNFAEFTQLNSEFSQDLQYAADIIIYIYKFILISYIVEYTHCYYEKKLMLDSFIKSGELGVKNVKVFRWRCSGAYNAISDSDLKLLLKIWKDGLNSYTILNYFSGLTGTFTYSFSSSGKGDNDKEWSGDIVSCRLSHKDQTLDYIKKHNW